MSTTLIATAGTDPANSRLRPRLWLSGPLCSFLETSIALRSKVKESAVARSGKSLKVELWDPPSGNVSHFTYVYGLFQVNENNVCELHCVSLVLLAFVGEGILFCPLSENIKSRPHP